MDQKRVLELSRELPRPIALRLMAAANANHPAPDLLLLADELTRYMALVSVARYADVRSPEGSRVDNFLAELKRPQTFGGWLALLRIVDAHLFESGRQLFGKPLSTRVALPNGVEFLNYSEGLRGNGIVRRAGEQYPIINWLDLLVFWRNEQAHGRLPPDSSFGSLLFAFILDLLEEVRRPLRAQPLIFVRSVENVGPEHVQVIVTPLIGTEAPIAEGLRVPVGRPLPVARHLVAGDFTDGAYVDIDPLLSYSEHAAGASHVIWHLNSLGDRGRGPDRTAFGLQTPDPDWASLRTSLEKRARFLLELPDLKASQLETQWARGGSPPTLPPEREGPRPPTPGAAPGSDVIAPPPSAAPAFASTQQPSLAAAIATPLPATTATPPAAATAAEMGRSHWMRMAAIALIAAGAGAIAIGSLALPMRSGTTAPAQKSTEPAPSPDHVPQGPLPSEPVATLAGAWRGVFVDQGLDKFPHHLNLEVTGGQVRGSYIYENHRDSLQLSGSITPAGSFTIDEYDKGKKISAFRGQLSPDGQVATGHWTRPGRRELEFRWSR